MGQIRIPRISAHQVQMPVEEGFTRCGWGSDFWNHDHGDSCWNDRIVFGFTETVFSVLLINDSVLFQISKVSVDLNYLGGGVLSKSGTPSRTWWNGCLSIQYIDAWGLNQEWSSIVPIFKTNIPGLGGLFTQTCVPQFSQKYRTLGASKSSLANVLSSPFVTRKFSQ